MRAAILGPTDSWFTQDLLRAARGRCELRVLPYEKLSCYIGEGCAPARAAGEDLGQFDCLLLRQMPSGPVEHVIFRKHALEHLTSAGVAMVNTPRCVEFAADKYLSLERLNAAGLKVPRTAVAQTVEDALDAFEWLGGDIVLKPPFGAEGRGIMRLDDADLARRVFELLVPQGATLYLQEYIDHEGYDIRAMMIGSHVLGMKRQNTLDWRTNAFRGATASRCDLSAEQISTARRAAEAVTGTFIGVDLLCGLDGTWYVIEVNATPGWKALASSHQVDVASLILDHMEEVATSGGT